MVLPSDLSPPLLFYNVTSSLALYTPVLNYFQFPAHPHTVPHLCVFTTLVGVNANGGTFSLLLGKLLFIPQDPLLLCESAAQERHEGEDNEKYWQNKKLPGKVIIRKSHNI